ncbi:MAG TPA: glycosyltransferase family 9 protein [Candidatus Binataceae bacterium]|nr:glycosyltransferase family 9 protein [Candidatus Binataceae bacterium]
MGDAVLVRSAIEHLRCRNESLSLGILAGDATEEVLAVGGNFRLHRYSQKNLTLRSALRTLHEIRACSYDALVNFEQASLAGSGFLHATGIPTRIGFVGNESRAKIRFLTHAIGFRGGVSMWQSFLAIARLIDRRLPDLLVPLPLPLSEEQLRAGRSWLMSRVTNPRARKIAFHLGCGSGQPFKRWPLLNFASLADGFSHCDPNPAIILTGQPHERALLAQFRSIYKGPSIDGTGLDSITMTASVLKECDLLVSNDTGVMHLGAAMGTPTVGLFGATSAEQWAPAGTRVTHVYETTAQCSPCVDSYRNIVPTRCANPDYGRCMAEIQIDSVLNAARRVVVGGWLT